MHTKTTPMVFLIFTFLEKNAFMRSFMKPKAKTVGASHWRAQHLLTVVRRAAGNRPPEEDPPLAETHTYAPCPVRELCSRGAGN